MHVWTPSTPLPFRSVVFGKLDLVTNYVHQQFVQVAQLHRVLSKKRDPLTHVCFLDAVAGTVGSDFLEEFWASSRPADPVPRPAPPSAG